MFAIMISNLIKSRLFQQTKGKNIGHSTKATGMQQKPLYGLAVLLDSIRESYLILLELLFPGAFTLNCWFLLAFELNLHRNFYFFYSGISFLNIFSLLSRKKLYTPDVVLVCFRSCSFF